MIFSTARLWRLVKTISVSCIGIQALLIVLGNLTDYDTNYQFVEHVLKMDTTFPTSRTHYRSLDSPVFFQAAYGFIILAEMLMSACCLWGSWLLIKYLNSDPITFQAAKTWGVVGLTIGILIWYLGFEVVGGEWFGMWQSTRWNGLASAERMVSFLMLTLILLHQHDG